MDISSTFNKKQRSARVGLILTNGFLTQEESQMVLERLYPDWPQSLKDKAGPLGLTVEAEDRMAQTKAAEPLPPESVPSPTGN